MIDDGKDLYQKCADQYISNWKDLTKSDLCNIYINTANPKEKEGAIAGIIYKCWNIFKHNYRDQPYIPLEDWYDSMIEAIMYVLEKHVWTDPTNILYGKPNGPEMALHRCIWSRKLNVYCANNKPKRIINKNIQSIEELKESAGFDPECWINEDAYIFIQYIQVFINKGQLIYAILLDLIAQGVLRNKLCKEIRSLDQSYINYFTTKYQVDRELVENQVQTLQNNNKLDQYIDYFLKCLQCDEDIIEYLKI